VPFLGCFRGLVCVCCVRRWDRDPLDITSYPELEQMVLDNKGRINSIKMGLQAGGMGQVLRGAWLSGCLVQQGDLAPFSFGGRGGGLEPPRWGGGQPVGLITRHLHSVV
jgi:hypothetical protein